MTYDSSAQHRGAVKALNNCWVNGGQCGVAFKWIKSEPAIKQTSQRQRDALFVIQIQGPRTGPFR